jgi:hypothetical protein
VAKRSPILGYNHNVRYRGLVFHVQTEDSGLLNPHLFTHLFHTGVIVSTRKLVYDAGANEEAIKALMQAQHKAVMKDLRKGSFDEKIDQYLGGTPGLEPRAGAAGEAPARPTDPELVTPPEATPAVAPAPPVVAAPVVPPAPPISEELSRPPTTLEIEAQTQFSPGIPSFDVGPPESVPILLTQKTARTPTADRLTGTAPTRLHVSPPNVPPPPSALEEAPTLAGPAAQAVAEAVQAANTVPVRQIRAATPPPIPKSLPEDFRIDSNPEIEISVGPEPGRATRDTDIEMPFDPATTLPDARRQDSGQARRTPTGDRPPSLVGATLPPAPKPPQRPAFTPPSVIARPAAPPDSRTRDTDATELYVPQPGEPDRPGQYSVGRGKPPSDNIPMIRDKAGGGRPGMSSSNLPRSLQQTPPTGHQKVPTGQQPPLVPPKSSDVRMRTPAVPTPVTREPGSPRAVPPRTGTTPIANRPPPGNVVMTRPAVVVGGPPKAAAPNPPRVRKAREDEGRGFGQGLISEKSLDEVILAYLSEDAEEK